MPYFALVSYLVLELEDGYLWGLPVFNDLCPYFGTFHEGLAYFYVPVFGDQQDPVQLQHLFLGRGQLLHLEGISWVDGVLFAAGLYYCVFHSHQRLYGR